MDHVRLTAPLHETTGVPQASDLENAIRCSPARFLPVLWLLERKPWHCICTQEPRQGTTDQMWQPENYRQSGVVSLPYAPYSIAGYFPLWAQASKHHTSGLSAYPSPVGKPSHTSCNCSCLLLFIYCSPVPECACPCTSTASRRTIVCYLFLVLSLPLSSFFLG